MLNRDHVITENRKAHKMLYKTRKRQKIKKYDLQMLVLTLPALLWFVIFAYIPMGGIIVAFKSYKYSAGIIGSPWIGFKNFIFFFASQDAWKITRNTVGYGIIGLVLGPIVAVIIALLLNEISHKNWTKSFQTIMILPNFMSWVVVAYVVYIFLNPLAGVVNMSLKVFGLPAVQWYAQPQYWPFILVFTNIWKGLGISVVLYCAALVSIDSEYYQAAFLDGASRIQQALYISVPSLFPLIAILSIMGIGNLFRGDFGLYYQIPQNSGPLYGATDVIDTYVYRALSTTGDVGMSAAVGLYQSFVGLLSVLLVNWIVNKVNPENAMF